MAAQLGGLMNVRVATTYSICLSGLLASLLLVTAATTQEFNPLRDLSADGTWDCRNAGAAIGTVVIAERSYAFIGADSRVAGYGKIHRVSEGFVDLPTFVIIDGPLKDDHGFAGTAMRGPTDDTENYKGEVFLELVTTDHKSTECVRRLVDGMRQ
jgi:hypothetical protein